MHLFPELFWSHNVWTIPRAHAGSSFAHVLCLFRQGSRQPYQTVKHVHRTSDPASDLHNGFKSPVMDMLGA